MSKSSGVRRQRQPRDWKEKEKLEAVLSAASLRDEELGEFLRRKGLHEAQLRRWRQEALGRVGSGRDSAAKTIREKERRIRELEKELRRKDEALAETAALLVLQKKVHQLWGDEDDAIAAKRGR